MAVIFKVISHCIAMHFTKIKINVKHDLKRLIILNKSKDTAVVQLLVQKRQSRPVRSVHITKD